MVGGGHERRRLDEIALRRARRIVELAWTIYRVITSCCWQNVGAHRWEVIDAALGGYADDLLHSAGHGRMKASRRAALDQALGVWVDLLRVVLVDAGIVSMPASTTVPTRQRWCAWHGTNGLMHSASHAGDDR